MNKSLAVLALAAIPFAVQAADTYTVDATHTHLGFAVDHLGVSPTQGQLGRTTGKFTLDRAAKSAVVELTVDATTLWSGDSDKGSRARSRDDHLKAADFFNVAEFPKITFKSTAVAFSGDQPAKIDGNLTLLGVTKPVSLNVERFKCVNDPFLKKERCGGVAVGKLKRSDFGMKAMLQYVGDEVALNISLEGVKD